MSAEQLPKFNPANTRDSFEMGVIASIPLTVKGGKTGQVSGWDLDY